MIYKFTGETKKVDGHVLNRIMATCDFRVANFDIPKWHVGGWIEKRENLQGEAWIDDDAMVYDDAVVTGNAFVCHNAKVYNRATVDGNALVCGSSIVSCDAVVLHDERLLK